MFSYAEKLAFSLLLPLALLLGLAFACDSGSGKSEFYSVIFKLDESCTEIDQYMLEFKAPYSRAFSGPFNSSQAIVQLKDFPAGEQQSIVTLGGAADYMYDTRLDSAWGGVATFNATCDEISPKPFLVLDLADSVFALSVPAECNWFPRGEWYEVVKSGPDSALEALQLLYSGNPNEQHRRMIHMFRNGEYSDEGLRNFMLRMTDANGKRYDFRYEFSTAEKHLYNYVISCDPTSTSVRFDVTLYIDGEEYKPAADGDIDGDAETAETEVSEEDGDAFEGSEIEDADGDQSEDEQNPDGDDTPDGDDVPDGDTENEVEAEDPPPVCDITEIPENTWSLLAKDGLVKDESTPSELAYIAESNNPSFVETEEYARLDATEVSHELVLALDVEITYMYSILVKYVKGVDWGMLELYLDDAEEPLELQSGGTEQDLHVSSTGSYDTVLPSSYSAYKPVCLNYGSHRLRFRVSGKNSHSSSYTIGAYKITALLSHQ